MTTGIEENFRERQECAREKARQLLRQILPKSSWEETENGSIIVEIVGKRGIYRISPYSQTEIRDISSRRCVAYTCLQLSIPAPAYDRMIAEYLLIKNTESVYWKTANIFPHDRNELLRMNTLLFFAFVFDVVLFVNLLLDIMVR